MVYYVNPVNEGIISAASNADGYGICVKWQIAYPTVKTNKIAYHLYLSTAQETVFSEGVKFIAINTTSVDIFDLEPGQLYFLAVRAVEYNEILTNPTNLPTTFNNLRIYPTSILRSDISATDLTIPLVDTTDFPLTGIIKIGVELINYSSVNSTLNNLILSSTIQRGFDQTEAKSHTTDGYDGYYTWDPTISYLLGREETNTKVLSVQSRFDLDNYQYTTQDGYHQVAQDLLTTDLAGSDASNITFPTYDYAGYHRTNPVDLLSGQCVGSYIGGQMFCADGYSGVGRMVRGISVQDQNNQREELLLSTTGEPVVLIKKRWTGITCHCYLPSSEYPDDRCPTCLGSKFVVSWEQYFNPRRSDGRIMVRFDPADDEVVTQEAGLESQFTTTGWTLTVPTIKDRDILVRFDQDGNEEFRYEVLSVTRNKTLFGLQGGQKFKLQRIRKFDPAYQIRVFRNTETLPSLLTTSISNVNVPGIGLHTHTIVTSNQPIANFSQISSVSAGHSHVVKYQSGQLIVVPVLGHTHEIIGL